MALACPPILCGCVAEVLDDDLGLLGQIGGVERDEAGDGPPRPCSCSYRGRRRSALDPPLGLVRRVVGQHVEDETLVHRLAH